MSQIEQQDLIPVFHQACKNGDYTTAKSMVEIDNIDKNVKDAKGMQPIHFATMSGNVELIEWLVSIGAQINARDDDGTSPLHIACEYGHLLALEWILKQKVFKNNRNKEGMTPLLCGAYAGHLEAVKMMINEKAFSFVVDNNGNTALHLAYLRGHTALVDWLISSGMDTKAKNKDGRTPLELKDVYVSNIVTQTTHQDVPLTEISTSASDHIVEPFVSPANNTTASSESNEIILLSESSPAISTPDEVTVPVILEPVVPAGNLYIKKVRIIISNDAHVKRSVYVPLNCQWDVLKEEMALRLDDTKATSISHVNLLDSADNNLLQQNISSADAFWDSYQRLYSTKKDLHYFVSTSSAATSDLSQVNFEAQIAEFLECSRNGNIARARDLVRLGVDIQVKDATGRQAIHYAAMNGDVEFIIWMFCQGVTLNMRDEDSMSALHYACKNGHVNLVRWLLSQNVFKNNRNSEGMTPLLSAAAAGHTNIVQLLIAEKALVFAANKDGNSALHLACIHGHKTLAKWLINNGMDETALNKAGKSPLDLIPTDLKPSFLEIFKSTSTAASVLNSLSTLTHREVEGEGKDPTITIRDAPTAAPVVSEATSPKAASVSSVSAGALAAEILSRLPTASTGSRLAPESSTAITVPTRSPDRIGNSSSKSPSAGDSSAKKIGQSDFDFIVSDAIVLPPAAEPEVAVLDEKSFTTTIDTHSHEMRAVDGTNDELNEVATAREDIEVSNVGFEEGQGFPVFDIGDPSERDIDDISCESVGSRQPSDTIPSMSETNTEVAAETESDSSDGLDDDVDDEGVDKEGEGEGSQVPEVALPGGIDREGAVAEEATVLEVIAEGVSGASVDSAAGGNVTTTISPPQGAISGDSTTAYVDGVMSPMYKTFRDLESMLNRFNDGSRVPAMSTEFAEESGNLRESESAGFTSSKDSSSLSFSEPIKFGSSKDKVSGDNGFVGSVSAARRMLPRESSISLESEKGGSVQEGKSSVYETVAMPPLPPPPFPVSERPRETTTDMNIVKFSSSRDLSETAADPTLTPAAVAPRRFLPNSLTSQTVATKDIQISVEVTDSSLTVLSTTAETLSNASNNAAGGTTSLEYGVVEKPMNTPSKISPQPAAIRSFPAYELSATEEQSFHNHVILTFKLAPSYQETHEIPIPQDAIWDMIVAQILKYFKCPSDLSLVLRDADGDDLSPHLNSSQKFWKFYNKFPSGNGRFFSVHPTPQVKPTQRESLSSISTTARNAEGSPRTLVTSLTNEGPLASQPPVSSTPPFVFDDKKVNKAEEMTGRHARPLKLMRVVLGADPMKRVFDVRAPSNCSWEELSDSIAVEFGMRHMSVTYMLQMNPKEEQGHTRAIVDSDHFWSVYYDSIQSDKTLTPVFHVFINEFITLPPQPTEQSVSSEYKTVKDTRDACKSKGKLGSDDAEDLESESEDLVESFHLACVNGDLENVKELLHQGVPVGESDGSGLQGIHFATISGNLELVQHLYSIGADLNVADNSFMTPFHYACELGHLPIVRWMLSQGVVVNSRNCDGMSPLLSVSASGSTEIVELLLKEKVNLSHKNDEGQNAVDIAIAFGHKSLATLLEDAMVDSKSKDYSSVRKGSVSSTSTSGREVKEQSATDLGPAEVVYNPSSQATALGPTSTISWTADSEAASSDGDIKRRADHPYEKDLPDITLESAHIQTNLSEVKGEIALALSEDPSSLATDNQNDKQFDNLPLSQHQISGSDSGSDEDSADDSSTERESNTATDLGSISTMTASQMGKDDRAATGSQVEVAQEDVASQSSGRTIAVLEKAHHLLKGTDLINSFASPLCDACQKGQLDIANALIQQGADVNTRNREGLTPLHLASRGGQLEIMHLLFQHGVDVNAVDSHGVTPLHLASEMGQLDGVELLLAQGGKVMQIDDDHLTPLHYCCLKGLHEAAELLVSAGADVNAKDKSLNTPLHFACMSGCLDLVEYLVLGVDAVWDARNIHGQDALDIATKMNYEDIVEFIEDTIDEAQELRLQEEQRKLAEMVKQEEEQKEAKRLEELHKAEERARAQAKAREEFIQRQILAEEVRQREEADARTRAVKSAELLTTCAAGNLNSALELIGMGADVNVTNANGSRPLHFACAAGHLMLAKELVRSGAHLNAVNNFGSTALHVACDRDQVDVVQWLLTLKTELSTVNADGYTPVHYLCIRNNPGVMETLCQTREDFDVNMKGKNGYSLLHCACEESATDIVYMLVELGADVMALDHEYKSALHFACHKDNMKVVKCLLKHPFDIHSPDKFGWTPLFYACASGDITLARFLVTKGAKLDLKDSSGNTCLHVACKEGDLVVSKWLIESGLDMFQKNNNQQSALDVALESKASDLIRWLKGKGAGKNPETPQEIEARTRAESRMKAVVMYRRTEEFAEFQEVCTSGDVGWLNVMLRDGLDPNMQNSNGSTGLHFASSEGHLKICKRLIEGGALPDIPNNTNHTPFHCSCRNGHLKTAQWLLSQGCDLMARAIDGRTALHYASANGHIRVAEWLIGLGTAVDVTSTEGFTPLYDTCANGHLKMAKHLVSDGADIRLRTTTKLTMMHAVSIGGHLEVGQWLMEEGASLDEIDETGMTPFLTACREGHLKVAMWLMSLGVNIRATGGSDRLNTALHLGCKHGHVEVSSWLLDCGLNPEAKNENGYTPHELASNHGYSDVCELLDDRDVDHFERKKKCLEPQLAFALNLNNFSLAKSILEDMYSFSDPGEEYPNGTTFLHLSAASGHFKITQSLVELGVDVNSVAAGHLTPLHYACGKGHLEVAQYLSTHGGLATEQDHNGNTVLHLAAEKGHNHVVAWLAREVIHVDSKNANSSTALHIASLAGHASVVKTLVGVGAHTNGKNSEGLTPLHCGCMKGHLDVVSQLVLHGADIYEADSDGQTPLDITTKLGYPKLTNWLLLQQQNSPNVPKKITAESRPAGVAPSPASTIKSRKSESVATLDCTLLFSTDPSHILPEKMRTRRQFAPRATKSSLSSLPESERLALTISLCAACSAGNLDNAKSLISKGADITAPEEPYGSTPLHLACKSGSLPLVKYITENGGVLEARDLEEMTPILVATDFKFHDIVLYLIYRGADTTAKSKQGMAMVHILCQHGMSGLLEKILDLPSNVLPSFNLELRTDEDQLTPLHIAAKFGQVEMIKVLVAQGVQLNPRDKDNRIPLHYSCRQGQFEASAVLLSLGAYVNSRDDFGMTPFLSACAGGHISVTKLLAASGASLSAETEEGDSALHLACAACSFDVVLWLLEKGLDPRTLNLKKKTCGQCVQSGTDGNEVLDLLVAYPRAKQLGRNVQDILADMNRERSREV